MMFHNQVYIDKDLFDLESEKSQESNKMSEKLGKMMIDLVRNIIHSARFNIKDIQNEVYYELEVYILEKLLLKYLKNYNSEKGKGFSLASMMIINLTYDFLRKLKTYDITGRPKYHKHKSILTNKRERITFIYLENDKSVKDNIVNI